MVAYGPLALGGTQVVFEGANPGRVALLAHDRSAQVTIFYTRPYGHSCVDQGGRNQRGGASAQVQSEQLALAGHGKGEPINPAAWEWYHREIGGGRCPIVDTFWQTETGGHMITPLPGAHALGARLLHLPFPGIDAAVVDETGSEVPLGQGGVLVVRKPWPSMIRTIWGDPERFKKSYYPADFGGQYYLAGDGADL